MNLATYLVAGLILAAAPAAYVTTDLLADPAEAAPAATSAASADPDALVPLTIRILHVGEPEAFAVSVWTADEEDVAGQHLDAVAGENLVEALVPRGALEVRLAGSIFSGSAPVDTAACEGRSDVLFVTMMDDFGFSGGGAIPGARCLAETDEAIHGVDDNGYAVAAPWPTCPLDCTMGYTFGSGERMEFDVREGAKSIEVVAAWSWNSPSAEEMFVGLFTPDDECGEGCWMGVDGASGEGLVLLQHVAPEPGPYSVSAMMNGPGVGLREQVHIEVLVRYS